jgi:hypothetical protein
LGITANSVDYLSTTIPFAYGQANQKTEVENLNEQQLVDIISLFFDVVIPGY